MTEPTTTLIDALLDAGLIQFGAFERGGVHEPYSLRLDLLPSYPAILKLAADAVVDLINLKGVDRLVCTHDAVPLATLVSQTLDVPLVVHNGTLGHPQRNLVGAYDVGHPAALLSLSSNLPAEFVSGLTADAAGVGLRLVAWFSLIETAPAADLPHAAPLHLADVAAYLVARGELSASMMALVGRG